MICLSSCRWLLKRMKKIYELNKPYIYLLPANFHHANFQHANIQPANIQPANFRLANLQRVEIYILYETDIYEIFPCYIILL